MVLQRSRTNNVCTCVCVCARVCKRFAIWNWLTWLRGVRGAQLSWCCDWACPVPGLEETCVPLEDTQAERELSHSPCIPCRLWRDWMRPPPCGGHLHQEPSTPNTNLTRKQQDKIGPQLSGHPTASQADTEVNHHTDYVFLRDNTEKLNELINDSQDHLKECMWKEIWGAKQWVIRWSKC